MEVTKEKKDKIQEGSNQKATPSKDTKRGEKEEANQWRVGKISMKRAKTLARLPQEKPPTTSKELILLSTPPLKGKEVVMEGNPFLALAKIGQGETYYRMIDTQEEAHMEEDEVEEYVPLS